MILTRAVAPAGNPVTLDEAKVQCAVLFDDHNSLIGDLIAAAVDYLDGPAGILGRAICTQTWHVLLEGWPGDMVLPVDPVSAAVVEYRAIAGGGWQMLTSSAYMIGPGSNTTVLLWQPDAALPDLASDLYPVRLTLTCGYGAPGSEQVPAAIRAAIKILVDHWYRHRGVIEAGQVSPELDFSVSSLISRYRRHL